MTTSTVQSDQATDEQLEELGVWITTTPSGLELDTDPALWSEEDRAALVSAVRTEWQAAVERVRARRGHPAWCDDVYCIADDESEEPEDRFHWTAEVQAEGRNGLGEERIVAVALQQHVDADRPTVTFDARGTVYFDLEQARALHAALGALLDQA